MGNHRGMGRVFQPRYTDKGRGKLKTSAVWWIEFSHNGKPHRESSKSRKETDAKKLLRLRLGEAGIGRLLPSEVANTTFEDLKALITSDYERNDRRSPQLQVVLKRLAGGFGGMKAVEITTPRITAHQAEQKKAGFSNPTINREMAALKRMFRLGHRAAVVVSVPYIPMLQEDNVRTGFFEREDFVALLARLPDDVKPLFQVAYITGWRVKSELLTRQWRHVDLVNKRLRLEPGEDKNKSGREFPFTSELERVITAQRKRADVIERSTGTPVPALFFRDDGTPIRSYRHAWGEAVKLSKVARIPHDFRRTAVRNLEIAGVARSAAMSLVGHKTEAIYKRYAIVDEKMKQQATRQLDTLHRKQASDAAHRARSSNAGEKAENA